MQFSRLAFWALPLLALPTRALDDLPFVDCGPKTHCADLYFCTIPADEWACRTGATPPSTKNGFMYGYKEGVEDPCVPGAAPIMRMKPGETYRVTLHNTADTAVADRALYEAMGKDYANRDFLLHTTNLHLHGVHVSGQGDHDNVMKMVFPGTKRTYIYVLPEDLQGGTHWYHPHFHGKVAHQVVGGAFGQVVIEDQERIGRTLSGGALDAATKMLLTSDDLELNLVAYSEGGLALGNGKPDGEQLRLNQGQWYRLRIVFVKSGGTAATAKFVSKGSSDALDWSSGCEAFELAYDGTYLSRVPYTRASDPVYEFSVHGAGRLDLAVRCNRARVFEIQYDGKKVATVSVSSLRSVVEASPFTGSSQERWAPIRPAHLADLRDRYYPSDVRRVAETFELTLADNKLNGKPFSETVPTATFAFGKEVIQPIKFTGMKDHPIHMHQQHFQVVQPGGCGSVHREGEFYDTITHTGDGPCLVRVRFVDFSGPTIIHCHVLSHEDMGMMGWFDIPFKADDSFEASPKFSDSEISKASVKLPVSTRCLDDRAPRSSPITVSADDICMGQSVRYASSFANVISRGAYANGEECHVLLQAPEGQKVRIAFFSLSTEFGSDMVTIYDGSSDEAHPLLAVSGKDLPAPLVTSGNMAYVKWVSDSSEGGRGWAMTYSAMDRCDVGDWTEWTDCSVTCGSGYQVRVRTAAGSRCPETQMARSCSMAPCGQRCDTYASADIKQFPGYLGSTCVSGKFIISANDDLSIHTVAALSGMEPSMIGGWHIHEGTTCDHEELIGGHYHPNDDKDDWEPVRYEANWQGSCKVDSVFPRLSLAQALGHALVIHAADGTRIGCGVISCESPDASIRSVEPTSVDNPVASSSSSLSWPVLTAIVCACVGLAVALTAGGWWLMRRQAVVDAELPSMFNVEEAPESEWPEVKVVCTPQAKDVCIEC